MRVMHVLVFFFRFSLFQDPSVAFRDNNEKKRRKET